MELHDVIRIRRAELGLTLDQVASACGVGKSIVAKWERGEVKNIRRDNLAALADVLRVSPLVLMEREELHSKHQRTIPPWFFSNARHGQRPTGWPDCLRRADHRRAKCGGHLQRPISVA